MEAKLIDSMGTDARVVDAARVSFHKLAENYTEEQNDKLIRYLANHNHWTPFAHPQITIHEKVPIFVARQRYKHVVGFTYNEVSRRYVDDEPEFFKPVRWRGKPENAKQGSSDKLEINDDDGYPVANSQEWCDDQLHDVHWLCKHIYEDMVRRGVAPEQARMVLPQSLYTEYYVTGSLAAWARAYKLRKDAHAQKEIQDLAGEWDKIIRPLFPKSWSALVD